MSALCSAALCSVDMLQGACAVNTCVFVCLGIAQCGGRVETRCLQKKEKECKISARIWNGLNSWINQPVVEPGEGSLALAHHLCLQAPWGR